MKRRRAKLSEEALHVVGLAFPHQARVDVEAVDTLRPERAQAQGIRDGRIHATAYKKEDVAISGDSANLSLDRPDAILGVPVLCAAAHTEHKVRENLRACRGVDDFRMKLHRHQRQVLMRHRRDRASSCAGEHVEPRRHRFHLISMIHPYLLPAAVEAREQSMWLGWFQKRETVLAFIAFAHTAAELIRHQLLAVTDTENGAAGGKNHRIDARAIRLIHAVRSTRNDQPSATPQFGWTGQRV